MALLITEKRAYNDKCNNTPDGFELLDQWLKARGIERVRGFLEATKVYGVSLAPHLYHHGAHVIILIPSRIKGYAKSQLSRTKNERADAGLIARFSRDRLPSLCQPAPVAVA